MVWNTLFNHAYVSCEEESLSDNFVAACSVLPYLFDWNGLILWEISGSQRQNQKLVTCRLTYDLTEAICCWTFCSDLLSSVYRPY